MNLTELLFALLVALNLADIVSTILKAPVLAGVYYVLVPPEINNIRQ